MKRFVTFFAGVTFGVIVTLYYELASKQPQPRIAKANVVMRYDNLPDWLEPSDYLDDAQPVYVGEDENEWRPEPWHDDIGGM